MRSGKHTPEPVNPQRVLEVACEQVRRFGEAKVNVVDIARALGTSHTTIYRHYKTKADVFDAIVTAAMRDEEELAYTYGDAQGQASVRLQGLVLALHRRKLERLKGDPEIYRLYRRIVDERPDLVQNYSESMTGILARIITDGVQQGEYKVGNVDAAAEVVRDAVTAFVHPMRVEVAHKAGQSLEHSLKGVLMAMNVALRSGELRLESSKKAGHRLPTTESAGKKASRTRVK